MSVLIVDIGVYQDTQLIQNTLFKLDTAFPTKEEADAYLLAIDTWLADIPTPVVEKTPIEQGFPAEHEVLMVTDKVDIMANRILDIIKPRDADIFGDDVSYYDGEADAAAIQRRPYNGTTLEAGWES